MSDQSREGANSATIDSDLRDRLVAVIAEIEDHYLGERLAPLTAEHFTALKAEWLLSIQRIVSAGDLGEFKERVDEYLMKLRARHLRAEDKSRPGSLEFLRASELSDLASAVLHIIYKTL